MLKYFNIDEFTCRCGCGKNNMDVSFLKELDFARSESGIPFIVNSGCRCETHNANEGGKPDSSHLYGLAVDIKCSSSRQRHKILRSLIIMFRRVGIAKTFIHVDNDLTKPPEVCWLY